MHVPQNRELNVHGMGLIRRLDIVEQLSRIRSPTLVCVGELDPVTPVEASEEIATALPDGVGEIAVIEQAGHFTWMDAPDRFWPTIVGFVERAAERPRP